MKSNITFYTTKEVDVAEWIEASAGIYGEEFREETTKYLYSFDMLDRNFDFISKMNAYFDDEDEESKTEFLTLLNGRLVNYVVLKIISIYKEF